jgi:hypothetical protein
MHVWPAQETCVRVTYAATGLPSRWIRQLLPSKLSSSGCAKQARVEPRRQLGGSHPPTATHDDPDEHDTELSNAPVAPSGSGTRLEVHRLPFQRSTSGTEPWAVPLLVLFTVPTAIHICAETHETPLSCSTSFGLDCCSNDQPRPSQRSIKGSAPANGPSTQLEDPTAKHTPLDTHETATSELSTESATTAVGAGVAWIVHRDPAHRSDSEDPVSAAAEESCACPTATHAFTLIHDTASSPACP